MADSIYDSNFAITAFFLRVEEELINSKCINKLLDVIIERSPKKISRFLLFPFRRLRFATIVNPALACSLRTRVNLKYARLKMKETKSGIARA